MMHWKLSVVATILAAGTVFAACGGDEPDKPKIGIGTKLCIPQGSCDGADGYFLTFYSTIGGEYKVTIHDSAGRRWSIVASGKTIAGSGVDATVHSEDIPGDGAFVRVTVVTSAGGVGRVDCAIDSNWETEPCR